MKTILLTLTALVPAIQVQAQGTVHFSNNAATAVTNLYTGDRVVAGDTFLAQLYYGPAGLVSDASLVSVTNAPATFVLPGIFIAGVRSTTLPGGSMGSFQVRVWEAVLGDDWNAAYANYLSGAPVYAGRALGKSDMFQVIVNDPYQIPPDTPTSIVTWGFKGFYIGVPEPSTLALGAVGVAALLWHRRKTN